MLIPHMTVPPPHIQGCDFHDVRQITPKAPLPSAHIQSTISLYDCWNKGVLNKRTKSTGMFFCLYDKNKVLAKTTDDAVNE